MNQEKLENKKNWKKSWQIPLAFGCIILGIMISLQFRSQKSEGFPFYHERTDLIKMIRGLEDERNRLQADLFETKKALEDYVKASNKNKAAMEVISKELDTIKMEAGLTAVEGPGVIVKLNDSPNRPKGTEDPYYFIVHDVDLQTLVNELWIAGAEAISVNDLRLVSNSSIRCSGPTILVNATRITPPYEVKSIGPPRIMESSLRMIGGFLDSMIPSIQNGVEIKIQRRDKIVIPAYKGSLIFRYAKPHTEKKEKKGNE
ncbi:MAG: DUF881 domain-containing protein [Candidatus Eremiobacteraeota bacterium]|nr:DUF881 domain-containing protein [Candidatus Eremiobacteraeota bacterium]